jgi:metal-responsive CopG/Arc/MetJ family transcriptional regulator
MGRAKVAITLNPQILNELDQLVSRQMFPNRSLAIEIAVQEKLERMTHARLARECSNLDPAFEQTLAEEGMLMELNQWPEY